MKRVSRPIKISARILFLVGILCLALVFSRAMLAWMTKPCVNNRMMNREQLSFSPDGKLAAYSLQETPVKVTIVSLDGSPNPHGVSKIANAKHPRFSPNSRTLVFSREEEETSHIWTADLISGKETQVTVGNHIDDNPLFDNDGSRILFMRMSPPYQDSYRTHDTGERVYSVPVAGEATSPAKAMEVFNAIHTGTSSMVIAQNAVYCSAHSASEDEYYIYVLPAGKSSPIKIGKGWGAIPIPQRKAIAFVYKSFGHPYGSAIWIMGEDGSGRRVLYDPPASNSSRSDLGIAADGQHLLFLEDMGWSAKSISLDGTDAKQLFRLN